MVKLELAATVEKEIGKAGVMTIDLAAMPDESLNYIFMYGLKQVLADAHSQAKTKDEATAMSEKKLAALYEGKFRVSSSRTSDPVLKEAKRLAGIALDGALAAKGLSRKDKTKEEITKAIEALAPRFMEKAAANVAENASLLDGIEI